MVLILLGIVLWLALGWVLIGIICIVLGIALLFVPGTYGVRERGRRRAPR